MTSQPVEILLVEDNEDDVVIIQEAFVESPLVNVINAVRDGEEALAYLRREGKYNDVSLPGLILLDINMPKKNGFEVDTGDESRSAIEVPSRHHANHERP